jgi:hypothetical protein
MIKNRVYGGMDSKNLPALGAVQQFAKGQHCGTTTAAPTQHLQNTGFPQGSQKGQGRLLRYI